MTDKDDWDLYKKLVMKELDTNSQKLDRIENRLSKIEERLTIINTKIYLAAFIASAVVTSMIQYTIGTI
tara:strand:- start:835 stop:1041 length:207 start_codon:yes stop_codon:yes gene_type:complete